MGVHPSHLSSLCLSSLIFFYFLHSPLHILPPALSLFSSFPPSPHSPHHPKPFSHIHLSLPRLIFLSLALILLSHSLPLFPYRMQALRPVVARQLPRKHSALLMERAHRVPSSTQTVPAEHNKQRCFLTGRESFSQQEWNKQQTNITVRFLQSSERLLTKMMISCV